MVSRELYQKLIRALENVPVTVLLGPRQVGKTTLAHQVVRDTSTKQAVYMDLELDSDLNKMDDPESYLKRFDNELVVIDEVQQLPNLFRTLRSLVDQRIQAGEKAGHFLLLGSASREVVQHSSESLAGRIRYFELTPFSPLEIYQTDPQGFSPDKLWFRGGFPGSFLASSDTESWEWRNDFIASYVERDIPLMGPGIPAARMKRFWTMLAHYHGQQVVYTELAKSLEVSHTTIRNYLDILTDFYMVTSLPPWSGNIKKRLIKSPKIYLRDSGLLHKLLNISEFEGLLGHPLLGASWEGFVVGAILSHASNKWQASYYRSASGSEIDLVLEGPQKKVWAIEIKRSLSPNLRAGFHTASKDIGATNKFVIYGGTETYPMSGHTEAIGLIDFLQRVGEFE